MDAKNTRKLEVYLEKIFGGQDVRIVPNAADPEMAEVYIDDEFVGTMYRDLEDGEAAYSFTMSILEADLGV